MKLTPEQEARRADLRKRNDLHEVTCDRISPRKKNGWRVIEPDEAVKINAIAPFDNVDRNELEILDFMADESTKPYFAYVDRAVTEVHTWMSGLLGKIYWHGSKFRSVFGDERINFRAKGIDGRIWAGTFYCSAGDYCRMRPVKS
ncbi:MAG: hypothetical protein KGI71_06210 [Patescibacteria group bacterium]|nr:hypothetical protein [Patescibacteria group bacterium]